MITLQKLQKYGQKKLKLAQNIFSQLVPFTSEKVFILFKKFSPQIGHFNFCFPILWSEHIASKLQSD